MKMIAAICLILAFGSSAHAQTKVTVMHAKGTFEVKLKPQTDEGGDPTVGRMSLDKQYHGDLEATSLLGQMLAVQGGAKGSAGYVAMERIRGTLAGHKGTFALQHTGTMAAGVYQLSVTVVPDSGTEDLTGIIGKMAINIVDGKHFYEFEYTFAK